MTVDSLNSRHQRGHSMILRFCATLKTTKTISPSTARTSATPMQSDSDRTHQLSATWRRRWARDCPPSLASGSQDKLRQMSPYRLCLGSPACHVQIPPGPLPSLARTTTTPHPHLQQAHGMKALTLPLLRPWKATSQLKSMKTRPSQLLLFCLRSSQITSGIRKMRPHSHPFNHPPSLSRPHLPWLTVPPPFRRHLRSLQHYLRHHYRPNLP